MRAGLIFFLVCCTLLVNAQKFMRLEVPPDLKKITYNAGSLLIFQLDKTAENDIWYAENIIEFDLSRQEIVFQNWRININDIIAVRKDNGGALQHKIGKAILIFGAGALFYGTVGKLTTCDNCPEAQVVGAACMVTGFLLDKIGNKKIYKIKNATRLRLFDLTPDPTPTTKKV